MAKIIKQVYKANVASHIPKGLEHIPEDKLWCNMLSSDDESDDELQGEDENEESLEKSVYIVDFARISSDDVSDDELQGENEENQAKSDDIVDEPQNVFTASISQHLLESVNEVNEVNEIDSNDGFILIKPKIKSKSEKRKKGVCKFFPLGICKHGDKCSFTHVHEKPKTTFKTPPPNVCKYWWNGTCNNGKYCRFPHESNVCKHFWNTGFCRMGIDCKFQHSK